MRAALGDVGKFSFITLVWASHQHFSAFKIPMRRVSARGPAKATIEKAKGDCEDSSLSTTQMTFRHFGPRCGVVFR